MIYHAHSGNRADKQDWQGLAEHLRAVGDLAETFGQQQEADHGRESPLAQAWIETMTGKRPGKGLNVELGLIYGRLKSAAGQGTPAWSQQQPSGQP